MTYETYDSNPLFQKKKKKLEKLAVTTSPALFTVESIVKAAQDAIVADQLVQEIDIDTPSESVKIPLESLGSATLSATEVTNTGFADIGGASCTYSTIGPFKFIQDAKFWGKTEIDDFPMDVLDWQMDAMGRNCAKIYNTMVIGLFADETNMIVESTISLGGSTLLWAIIDAASDVQDAGYEADTVLLSPASYADLLKDTTFTSTLYMGEPGLKSAVSSLLGLKFVVSGAASDTKVHVFDSKVAAKAAWRNRFASEPVEIAGTYGAFIKGRVAVKLVRPQAVAVIEIA